MFFFDHFQQSMEKSSTRVKDIQQAQLIGHYLLIFLTFNYKIWCECEKQP